MDLSLNRQRNPDPVVAFKTLDSLFNVLQDFNTLGKKGPIYSTLILQKGNKTKQNNKTT